MLQRHWATESSIPYSRNQAVHAIAIRVVTGHLHNLRYYGLVAMDEVIMEFTTFSLAIISTPTQHIWPFSVNSLSRLGTEQEIEPFNTAGIPFWSPSNSLIKGYKKVSRFFGPFGPGMNLTHSILCRLARIAGGRFRHSDTIGHMENLVFAFKTWTASVVSGNPKSVGLPNKPLILSSGNSSLVQ